jgi:hypothetical protein
MGGFLDVLDLFADLVDQHLQLHRCLRRAGVDRFGAQRVRLAIELLQQEIQPPSDRLLLRKHAADFGDVAVEAIEFLVDVELLQRQHQLLLQPPGIGRLREIGQACFELGALARADHRHQRAHLARPLRDRIDAFADHRCEVRPFPLARCEETGEDFIEQRQRLGLQGRGIAGAATQHARKLQQVGQLHLQRRETSVQFARQVRQLPEDVSIQMQRFAAFGRPQAHRQVQLAARDARRDTLAQRRFQRAQFIGQAHAELEEPVVDRAQFTAQRAPFGRALAGREGGHAADHAELRHRPGGEGADGKLARPVAVHPWLPILQFPRPSRAPAGACRRSCAR